MSTIFVSIAAYRDPELLPTLRSCLETAANPQDLRFCIAWQHAQEDLWDNLDDYYHDNRFHIIDIPHRETKGVCWARHQIQNQYGNQTYYLQLDSHHRFSKGWDETIKDHLHYLQAIGHEKPLLSAYLPPYHPKNDPAEREQRIYALHIDRFLPEGVAFLTPGHVPEWKQLSAPFPARFVSAHFLFTVGRFAREVPYDPKLYFHGEESSLAARAFTHGYDLFSPHRPVIWHEYHRQGKARHWDDCTDWHRRNSQSYARYRELFQMDDPLPGKEGIGHFGFGASRRLADYEKFIGVQFGQRRIHKETLEGRMPPIESDLESEFMKQIKVCIDVPKDSLPETDYDFLVVALLDQSGADLYRQDCDEAEIRTLFSASPNDRFIHIWRSFCHDQWPDRFRVWPHSRSIGWTDRIEQPIPHE